MRRFPGILVVLAASLVLAVCSSPTEPAPPAGTPGGGSPGGGITIVAASTKLLINETTTLTVRVADPSVAQVGLSTDLGNFGLDGTAKPIQSLSVTLSNGQTTQQFFAGAEEGTATILANASSLVVSVQVTVEKPPPLFLQKLDPTFGPPGGGTEVTISGQGLRATARVTFGGALAEFVAADPSGTSLKVKTPQSSMPVPVGTTRSVDVVVTLADDGTGQPATDTLEGAFTYAHGDTPLGPSILSVEPSTGPNRGGVRVTILGSGFEAGNVVVAFGLGDTVATFAGIEATVRSSTATRIVVELPQATPALLNQTVGVLVRNGTTGLANLANAIFTYAEVDVITDIQPREASYMGGTSVTITTQGLDRNDSFSVQFGGTFQGNCPSAACSIDGTGHLQLAARAVTVKDCELPQGEVMVTDTVTGELAVGPSFSYTAEMPSIQSISPARGGENGVPITLTGQFSRAGEETLVLIDGVVAAITSQTPSRLLVTAPPFSGNFDEVSCDNGEGMQFVPKAVDVEVLYPATGCTEQKMGGFTYVPQDESCRKQPTAPVASFTFVVGGTNDLTVQLTDTSSGSPTSWRWTFGDGATSNEQNPSHTYQEGGTFNVTLQVTNAGGSSSITQAVKVGPDAPVASFTYSIDSANPLLVSFLDTSRNDPSSWTWTFGDGGGSSQQNPTHTYATAGTFNVTLQVANVTGTDSVTQAVDVGPDPPVASFTFRTDPTDPERLTIVFTNTSIGATSVQWFFGDGGASTMLNPSHDYGATGPGVYSVILQATNAAGTDEITQDVRVGVPVARFTYSIPNPMEVQFTDTSAGVVTSRIWDFGDGVQTNAINPLHMYAASGTYTVTLQISNAAGSDVTSRQVVVP